MTVAVWVTVTESVVSVAVYVTASAVASLTVKVTTPLALEGPDALEIVELPPAWPRVTVLPATGLLLRSFSVTVTVEVATPLSRTLVGLAETVDCAAVGVPVKITFAVWETMTESVVSVAV